MPRASSRVEYQPIPDSDDEEEDDQAQEQQQPGSYVGEVVVKPRRTTCFCVSCILLVVLLLLSVIVLTVLLLVVGRQPPRVETECGDMEGVFVALKKVFTFKGIPFALPPEKERRWKPPVPLSKKNGTCWSGLYKADNFKARCAQWEPSAAKVNGSEDCLYMNVFTPSIDPLTGLLPVMVYIHGGGLESGGADTPGYVPDSYLTSKLGVVFVSVQYRLSSLGFLVADELSGNGNYGYLDQLEALRWVKANIHAFGGDAGNVTLFGHGSGATAAWALTMSRKAKHLFHKVWLSSPSPLFNKTAEDARKENEFFANHTLIQKHCPGVPSESCLRAVPVADVLQAVHERWPNGTNAYDLPTQGHFDLALPVIDGDLFHDSPVNLLAGKHSRYYSDVPVIFGTTAQEVDWRPTPYAHFGPNFEKWDAATYDSYVATHLDPFGVDQTNKTKSITNSTRAWYKSGSVPLSFVNTVTDLRVTCGVSDLAAMTASAFKSTVYRYVVTGAPSRQVTGPTGWQATRAFHGWDICSFFEGFAVLFAGSGPTAADSKFGGNLQEEVMSFVATGRVMTKSWTGYPNTTALLGETTNVQRAYNGGKCDFWKRNGFLDYSWVN